jgi:pilus assembly protein Flp/PilA
MRRMRAFLADARGSTAIEYCLIIAGIALALVTALYSAGAEFFSLYAGISGAIAALAGV